MGHFQLQQARIRGQHGQGRCLPVSQTPDRVRLIPSKGTLHSSQINFRTHPSPCAPPTSPYVTTPTSQASKLRLSEARRQAQYCRTQAVFSSRPRQPRPCPDRRYRNELATASDLRDLLFCGHVHVSVHSSFKISKSRGILCASQLPITVTKYLRQSTLREKRFILSHGFRGFSPWLLGVEVHRDWTHLRGRGGWLVSWWPESDQRGASVLLSLPGHTPSDESSPTRPCLLKAPPPPNGTTGWGPLLLTWPLEDI
ncbi:uncharacterized protein LOC124960282 isoform X2 [Sciurus carolinensis]|uniref:uncharacterized protein LOC124960282 isoform X2 n=1 Tax=Sciurus carolinensis TaxID=30640 RepID=UPI001FB33863|nr:uncharacterized protein LOC124960282 isoform X2 [Sciurus carolinensis]